MSKLQVKSKSRLGRGLSSLISISELPVESEVTPLPQERGAHFSRELANPAPGSREDEIALDQITPNPHQPRRQFNEASIADLSASIKSSGLVQPIVVRKVDGGYQLIAGERRLRAAKLAGLTTIPAVVRNVDSFKQAQLALIENIHREDLNPIDRASAYRALIEQLGLTQAELAARLGEDRSSIANFLRLLDLAEPVRAMLRDGTLSTGHAKILAGVNDILEQERIANLVINQGLSVRNLERIVAAPPTVDAPPRRSESSAHIQDLEKSCTSQLGMRVQIRSGIAGKGRGRLVIHYSSLDQFDELLGKLGIKANELE